MSDIIFLNIEVEYVTHSKDQCVYLNLSSNKKLRAGLNEPIKMKSEDGQHWYQTIELPSRKMEEISYGFTIKTKRSFIDEEKGHGQYPHHIFFSNTSNITIKSLWHIDQGKNYLYSSAYSKTIYPFNLNPKDKDAIDCADIVLLFTDYIPPRNCQLYLCGNGKSVGEWKHEGAILGHQTSMGTWAFPLKFSDVPQQGLIYKYILVNKENKEVIWEVGENRELSFIDNNDGKFFIDTTTPNLPQNDLKAAGVVVPVFSLRSEQSWGIGDFGDLIKFIDWAAEAGLNVIQLLPVNDTTREGNWHDSYPYNPISSFALHPIYMDFNSLPQIKSKTKLKIYEQRRQQVNAQQQLDYDEVFDLKEQYLHTYYQENKQDILRSTKYKVFKRDNADWLIPYSFFRYLLKIHGTANFRKWPKFKEYNPVDLQRWAIASNLLDDIDFYGVLQFLLDKQLSSVHDYAQSKGIVLKGDIPIGVSRDSVPSWVLPKYLNSDSQAGAPPDFFSAHGQNWGFPTYNWPNILADDAKWWKDRLTYMSRYFDAYRIDHVLGFFRIWEIPIKHYYGTLGHFNPGLPLTNQQLKILGFTDDPEYYTKVRFTEGEMQRHFGELLPVAKEYFFEFGTDGKWTLKKNYAHSQRAIDNMLREMGFSGQQRELFLSAYTNVLFIKTLPETKTYHLNILGKQTKIFKHLSQSNSAAYERIYEYFFYERHNNFWTEEAYRRLPKLTCATSMLACAEDLGMIPSCVPSVLKALNILTLEIETMPKKPNMRFSNLSESPLYSVDTISTHDMAPLRLWWKQNPESAVDYWCNILHKDSHTPGLLSPEDCEIIIARHMRSSSLLCIIALQDWLGIDSNLRSENLEQEQINHPEIPRHYWRWRMIPTIEQLISNKQFTAKVKKLSQLRNNSL